MEIKNATSGLIDPYRARLEVEGQKLAARQAGTEAKPGAQQDRISVSPEAKLLTASLSAATQAPDVRQQKVDAIKEQIAAGTYSIDARTIAQKMVQEERALHTSLEG